LVLTEATIAVLGQAREALARHAWTEAYDLLAREGSSTEDPDVHEALAEAAWWVGRIDECIAARERLYRSCEDAGDSRRAARTALWLYDNHCFKGQRAVASGWLGRARRLLEPEPECIETGMLLVREAETAHSEGELDAACLKAGEALELGRRLRQPDLEADSLQCLGRIMIVQGKPHDGLALYDEAMLAAVEGRVGPFVAGKTYCSLISACEELGDLRRAGEWTDVGALWASSHPFSAFPGLCRVHRAEVLQLRGDWSHAEAEARLACSELDGVNVLNTALGFREIGEIRRRLGDLDAAEEAFRRAADLGMQPQPGLALLRLAQGKIAVAVGMIGQALREEPWNRLARAKLLPAAVQVGIAAHGLDDARAAADELDAVAAEYGSDGIEAAAASARGRLQLAGGDIVAAASTLRRALQRWQELDVPYEVATTRVLLGLAARQSGDEEGALSCFTSAVETFARLGAALDVAQVEQVRGPRAALPAGLTEREAEVLRLVASGATNKAVARDLGLSEKTVARHLSNIFTKLGVASRAGATAYAFEHGLTGSRH
jgi:DNA-binding NarL/FixJ family response regulator